MTKNFDIFPKTDEDIANLSVFQQYQDVANAGYAVLTGLVGSRTSSSKVSYTAGTYSNGGLEKSSSILPHLYIDSVPAAAAGKLREDLIYIDGADNIIKREAGTELTPDDPAKFLENYNPKPPQLADTDWIVLSIILVTETGISSSNFGSYATAGVHNARKASGMAADDVTLTVDANGVLAIKDVGSLTTSYVAPKVHITHGGGASQAILTTPALCEIEEIIVQCTEASATRTVNIGWSGSTSILMSNTEVPHALTPNSGVKAIRNPTNEIVSATPIIATVGGSGATGEWDVWLKISRYL